MAIPFAVLVICPPNTGCSLYVRIHAVFGSGMEVRSWASGDARSNRSFPNREKGISPMMTKENRIGSPQDKKDQDASKRSESPDGPLPNGRGADWGGRWEG